MTSFAKVFPTSHALLHRYHIKQNIRGRSKGILGNKQIKREDGKMVKPIEILEHIKEAWISIINSSTEELYVTYVTQLVSVCTISIFLKYVESKILNKVKEKIICA